MPDPTEAFRKLIEAGGVLGALLVIAFIAIGLLFVALQRSETKRIEEGRQCSQAQEAVFEKRLEEAQRATAALEKNTATLLALIASSDARNTAFQEMVKGFAVLVESFKSEADQRRETLSRIETRQDRILDFVSSRNRPVA